MDRSDVPTDSFTGSTEVDQRTKGADRNDPYPDGEEHVDLDELFSSLDSGITLLDIEGDRRVPVLHSLVLDHLRMNDGAAF